MEIDCKRYYEAEGETSCPPRDAVRFQKTFPHVVPEGMLLDVGCREGYWLDFLREQAPNLQLFACDVSLGRAQRTGKKHKSSSVCAADIRSLPYRDDAFDQVTCLEVLEHVPEWQDAFFELLRVTAERLIITVPYAEKLVYGICGDCGTQAHLYGHIHSFRERDFSQILNGGGQISFERFDPPMGLGHYAGRIVSNIRRRMKKAVPAKFGDSEPWIILCPSCYKKMPYSSWRVIERSIQRIRRLVTQAPEHLLIEINKP